MESTPLVTVDNDSALAEMAQHLAQQREIAVDLEAHSYRSFQGFTCLIQVRIGRISSCLLAGPRNSICIAALLRSTAARVLAPADIYVGARFFG